MKSKEKEESRIGPVNPFALGSVFIEAAKKLGWMDEELVERQRRYYITPKGFAEMEKLGMDLQRIAHYKPMTPRPETIPSRHERPDPQPGNAPPRYERQMPPAEIRLSHHERPVSRNYPSRRERPASRQENSPSRGDRPRHPDRQHDRHNDRHRR